MDFPDAVDRLMLLDISPTLAMYESTDRAFATAYFHWFFLIQPAPLPESLIEGNPSAYVDRVMGNRHAGPAPFAPHALEAYRDALAEWRKAARDVSGRALPCGHYIPEEAPDVLLEEIRAFFAADAPKSEP